jgi:hypothetical protein
VRHPIGTPKDGIKREVVIGDRRESGTTTASAATTASASAAAAAAAATNRSRILAQLDLGGYVGRIIGGDRGYVVYSKRNIGFAGCRLEDVLKGGDSSDGDSGSSG